MLFEIALLSVAIPAAYSGVQHVRRRPFGTATFAWMLLATAALAAAALAGRRLGTGDALDVLGAIAIGAGLCLLVMGPLLRHASRWAVTTERLRLATLLVDLRDLLQPGTGGREEKILVLALREVRAGRVDDAVGALWEVRDHATPAGRRHIDERIALLYLSAFRFREAVDYVERVIGPVGEPVADSPAAEGGPAGYRTSRATDASVANAAAAEAPSDLDQAPAGADPAPATATEGATAASVPSGSQPASALPPPLADLPVSPVLYTELIGAYARLGDLDRAAAMADDIDRRAAGSPDLVYLVHRVRLVFLAFAGCAAAVDRLLSPALAGHMTPAARSYWAGVARERAGDRAGARAAYQEAAVHARREPRARDAVARALAEVERSVPAALSPPATAVAARLSAAELTMPPVVAARRSWLTMGLIAGNVVVAAAVAIAVGGTGDIGTVVRAGGNLRSAVDLGEWWRLPFSAFVHVGPIHLAVNALVLWLLGRVAEVLLGRVRMFAVYGAAAIGGATASYLFSAAGISAGASGAIFGLLGALLVELALHRDRYRRAWHRGLLSALTMSAAAQLIIGFFYPIIDQWAHVGGLLSGGVTAVLVSPHARLRRAGSVLATIMSAAGAVVFAWAAVCAATTDFGETLARYPHEPRVVDGLSLEVPANLVDAGDGLLVSHDRIVGLALVRLPHVLERPPDEVWSALVAKFDFDTARRVPQQVVPLPAGWSSQELVASIDSELSGRQRFRVILFARFFGGEAVLGALAIPEVLAPDASGQLASIIASIRIASAPDPSDVTP